jgi:phospholipase/carboxylesterase
MPKPIKMHKYEFVEKGKSLEEAEKAIILLHGRGATAQNILSLADEFCDDRFYIAAPQATNNTWYPYSFMEAEANNEPWLSSAIDTVKHLIDETAKEIGYENLYLMGFSQGACLTLEVAARNARRYAGISAFTGGLIGDKINPAKYKGDFHNTPVFIGNSDIDPHIPVSRSEKSKAILAGMNAKVKLEIYPNMPHTIIQEEIDGVKKLMF